MPSVFGGLARVRRLGRRPAARAVPDVNLDAPTAAPQHLHVVRIRPRMDGGSDVKLTAVYASAELRDESWLPSRYVLWLLLMK